MRRKGIQLCYPISTERLSTWSSPYVVQPKLDGERCRVLLDPSQPYPGGVTLLTSEENEFKSVPHLLEPLHKLASLTGRIELDGELYAHGLEFSEIHSIVGRTVNLNTDYERIQLHLFDVVNVSKEWT